MFQVTGLLGAELEITLGSQAHSLCSLPICSVCVRAQLLSHVQLSMISWTVVHQAPLSMEFSRQEYWSGLSFPSPGDLPDPGIEHGSHILQADSLLSEPLGGPSLILNFCSLIVSRFGCIIYLSFTKSGAQV